MGQVIDVDFRARKVVICRAEYIAAANRLAGLDADGLNERQTRALQRLEAHFRAKGGAGA